MPLDPQAKYHFIKANFQKAERLITENWLVHVSGRDQVGSHSSFSLCAISKSFPQMQKTAVHRPQPSIPPWFHPPLVPEKPETKKHTTLIHVTQHLKPNLNSTSVIFDKLLCSFLTSYKHHMLKHNNTKMEQFFARLDTIIPANLPH